MRSRMALQRYKGTLSLSGHGLLRRPPGRPPLREKPRHTENNAWKTSQSRWRDSPFSSVNQRLASLLLDESGSLVFGIPAIPTAWESLIRRVSEYDSKVASHKRELGGRGKRKIVARLPDRIPDARCRRPSPRAILEQFGPQKKYRFDHPT